MARNTWLLILVLIFMPLILIGCHSPTAEELKTKYTEPNTGCVMKV